MRTIFILAFLLTFAFAEECNQGDPGCCYNKEEQKTYLCKDQAECFGQCEEQFLSCKVEIGQTNCLSCFSEGTTKDDGRVFGGIQCYQKCYDIFKDTNQIERKYKANFINFCACELRSSEYDEICAFSSANISTISTIAVLLIGVILLVL